MSRSSGAAPMTMEELEAGLCRLHRQAGNPTFWDKNILAFRRTLLVAIGETSAVLATKGMPLHSWIDLDSQLARLRRHLKLADDYMRSRNPDPQRIN